MASHWHRHLLSLAEGDSEAFIGLGIESVVAAGVVTVVLVLVLLMCTCDKGRGYDLAQLHCEVAKTELQSVSRRNSSGLKTILTSDITAGCMETVDDETGQTTATGDKVLNNGLSTNRNSVGSNSHSRQASSGSMQMRPTSLRELPEVPTSNHSRNHSGSGGLDKQTGGSRSSHGDGGDDDDGIGGYDHLCARVGSSNKPAKNYDHIKLDSPGQVSVGVTPVSDPDNVSENHYAQVRERTYDVVKDVRARGVTNSVASRDFDPYAKVKDDDDEKEDPYAKVRDGEKEDADYSHLKHKHVMPSVKPSQVVVMDDEEDPYERVIGDSGSARVQVPLSTVDLDDPYSTVMDQPAVSIIPMHCTTVTITNSSGSGGAASARHVNGAVHAGHHPPRSESNHFHLQYADEDSEVQGDYAVVMKDRQGSTNRRLNHDQGDGEDETTPYFPSPPEPPRLYGVGDAVEHGAVGGNPSSPTAGSRNTAETKEHKYTKVTARESLASMTARNALNTYEVVPDLAENTYATVEGGSGDGVVRYASPSLPHGYALQQDTDLLNETYAEINASASGTYTPTVPEPPSLDTLHFMTKSTTSNEADHSFRNSSSPSTATAGIMDDGYATVSKTSNFSPSETALPQIPRSSTTGNVHNSSELTGGASVNGITTGSGYRRGQDYVATQDLENDPNYESVDEAYARLSSSGSTLTPTPAVTLKSMGSPSRRQHEYEEVSPSSKRLNIIAGRKSAGGTTVPFKGNSFGQRAGNASAETPNGAYPTPVSHQPADAAANARDWVLEGHMYEDISEVQKRKRSFALKTAGESGGSKGTENKH